MHKRIISIIIFILVLSFLFACDRQETETEDSILDKFPLYVEDYQNLVYTFDSEQREMPFWKSNVIYNETVMLLNKDEETSGKLLFSPLKILSVRDYSLETEYIEGVDYTIENNIIKRTENSNIPYLDAENLQGINMPAPYRLVGSISNVLTDYVMMGPNAVYTESPFYYGNQLSVSYVYDVNDIDLAYYPDFDEEKLPNTLSKLKNKEQLRISAIGDSVLEGNSSSGTFNRAPFMPDFMTLTKEGLENAYNTEIILNNISVGGKTSVWGSSSTMINNLVNTQPDLVFIHFGINDAGDKASANSFRDNIELMILSLKAANPNVEVVILSCFSPNPLVYDTELFEKYWEKMSELETMYQGVKIIDLWRLSENILSVKKYEDVTGNGINHVNDYSARLYLMSIMATLYTY